MSFGPLFQLQLWGTICPCIQKEEDRNARQAVALLNAAGQRITWVRNHTNNTQNSFSRSGLALVGEFFRKANSSLSSIDTSGSDDPPPPNVTNGKRNEGPCVARLILQDSPQHGQPEIVVDPTITIPATQKSVSAKGSSSSSAKATALGSPSPSFKLNIKLKRVDKVRLEEGHIVLTARPSGSSARDAKNIKPAKELLRFGFLEADGTSCISQDDRNMLLHHLQVVVEWERQRRAAAARQGHPLEDDGDDDDEDEDAPNFLAARASKAAHFAKRELELQQTKRERDQRKAKLVEASGGLKYTALALANRET